MYRIIYKFKDSLNVNIFKLQRKHRFFCLSWWYTVLKSAKLSEVKQWAIKYDCRSDVKDIVGLR